MPAFVLVLMVVSAAARFAVFMLVTEIMLFVAMFIFMRVSMRFAAAIMFMGMFIFVRMSAAA